MADTPTCDCTCHHGPYYPCSHVGGCGSTGCGRDTKASSCVTCPVLRPDNDPRLPHYPPVCDGDRALLDRHLVEIANLSDALTNPEPPVVDVRRYERFDRNGDSLGTGWADPTAAVGGVAPINSRSKQPDVSGSRDKPLPIPVHIVDLQAPLRPVRVSQPFRGDAQDQIGHIPVAVMLAEWVRNWRDTLWPGQHLPKPGIDQLVVWLRTRLQDACDQHPGIADFAEEIRNTRSALRSAAGETEPQPELCVAVPCKRCDLVTLFRQPGGDVACANPDCQTVLRADEYADWVKTLAAAHKMKRHARQNA